MDLKPALFFFLIFVSATNCQKHVLEIETDMRGRLIVPPSFENEHQIDPFQNESEKKPQKIRLEYGSFERGIMPSAGPMSAYGHPADRYKKKNGDELEPLTVAEAESNAKVVGEGQQQPVPLIVNGIQNVAIADTDADPDPDPFTFKRRIMPNSGFYLIPDAYDAAPIIKSGLESVIPQKLSATDATSFGNQEKALAEKSILEQFSFENENLSESELTGFKNDKRRRRQHAAPTVFRNETIEPAFPLPSCYRTTAGFDLTVKS
uniref:Uncharacterized protein n=1 Tax=Panagrolaimus sp. JU765 TaxID=591449 RepID=A0AC34RM61_9BILA